MISKSCQNILKNGRNLLAFSHGVDSTALFYVLIDFGIEFDIAIVDYNTRKQSKDEISSAFALANKFNKTCFTKSVNLENSNFESNARRVRYEFFDEIFIKNNYQNLILAHQLNDLFEWFLMQFSKGAGLNELIGMKEIEQRAKFTIVRPLLSISKDELLGFLQKRNLKYFIDKSNESEKYTRNKFRYKFSEPFLAEFKKGVAKSFEFLAKDAINLEPEIRHIKDSFYMVKNDKNAVRGVDTVCKILGVVMSEKQRQTCLTNGVISGKVAVGVSNEWIYITPFIRDVMDKKFKEKCRVSAVPSLNRSYLYVINFELTNLEKM